METLYYTTSETFPSTLKPFDCFDPDFKLIETQCRIFLELFVVNALLLLLTTRGGGGGVGVPPRFKTG